MERELQLRHRDAIEETGSRFRLPPPSSTRLRRSCKGRDATAGIGITADAGKPGSRSLNDGWYEQQRQANCTDERW
jgi:hypothetical protein